MSAISSILLPFFQKSSVSIYFTHSFKQAYIFPKSAQAAEETKHKYDNSCNTHEYGWIEEYVNCVSHFLIFLNEDEKSHRWYSHSKQLKKRESLEDWKR